MCGVYIGYNIQTYKTTLQRELCLASVLVTLFKKAGRLPCSQWLSDSSASSTEDA